MNALIARLPFIPFLLPFQVDLLLGKAYSEWGHISDAVSVYNQLISTYPDDFRGYLAKGIILKENGNVGDAERMFIQDALDLMIGHFHLFVDDRE
ncbi:hypothetical protein MTR67_015988 [Solanum verrucosum]|uniref:Tetratricopeptide repeat protein n=1 Tax=Solanum verrucosum TaxID=315347 RepID=A0AAF0QGF4_SOLVR|nr:hypothetical protein MTR67_015988 [Solanum verrucosum]